MSNPELYCGNSNKFANSNSSSSSNVKVRKRLWSPDEDERLMRYMLTNGVGQGRWSDVARDAGLQRCGKSCRLRWINYLRPDLKRGAFSIQEEDLIIRLHSLLGNRWSRIAARLPGRTDNEIKNFWNSRLKKRLNNIASSSTLPTNSSSPTTASSSLSSAMDVSNDQNVDNGLIMSMQEQQHVDAICPARAMGSSHLTAYHEPGSSPTTTSSDCKRNRDPSSLSCLCYEDAWVTSYRNERTCDGDLATIDRSVVQKFDKDEVGDCLWIAEEEINLQDEWNWEEFTKDLCSLDSSAAIFHVQTPKFLR